MNIGGGWYPTSRLFFLRSRVSVMSWEAYIRIRVSASRRRFFDAASRVAGHPEYNCGCYHRKAFGLDNLSPDEVSGMRRLLHGHSVGQAIGLASSILFTMRSRKAAGVGILLSLAGLLTFATSGCIGLGDTFAEHKQLSKSCYLTKFEDGNIYFMREGDSGSIAGPVSQVAWDSDHIFIKDAGTHSPASLLLYVPM